MQSAGPLFTRPVNFLPFVTSLAVAGTAVSVSANSIPSDAGGCVIGNITADVNWLYGADPTASVGIPLPLDSSLVIEDIAREDIPNLRFIQQSAGSTLVFQWIAPRSIYRS